MPEKIVPTAYSGISAYAIYLNKGGKGNYANYLKRQVLSGGKGGCGCEGSSHEDSCCDDKKDCSCCPPGLVGVWDDKGNNLGCLTPADAELYTINTYECADGYAKLMNNTTGDFLGCVSESQFATLYPLVNS